MKQKVLSMLEKKIRKQYPKYNDEKIETIMYGLEGIYLTITKAIIIFTIAFLLNIQKELLFLLLAFNIIRASAFGMHASESYICLIFSSLLFLGGSYLCKIITIHSYLLFAIYPLMLLVICAYAPADTVKRPLIKKKKRTRLKIISIVTAIMYFILSIFIKDNLLINAMFFGLIIECILINPITYKLFKMPYKNYVNYNLNTN